MAKNRVRAFVVTKEGQIEVASMMGSTLTTAAAKQAYEVAANAGKVCKNRKPNNDHAKSIVRIAVRNRLNENPQAKMVRTLHS